MDYGYRNQKGNREGQKGPSYPNLQDSNPSQTVRDTYRQPQEDAYKMQPGRFMPPVNPNAVDMNSDGRATVRDASLPTGENFDARVKSFASLDADANMHQKFVSMQVDSIEGRR